jgi:hypothetical protein
MRRETMEILTVIALLLSLIGFNIAALLVSSDDARKGRPARTKGQTKESRVVNSWILQGVTR